MIRILASLLKQQHGETPNDLLDQILAIQDGKMEHLTDLTYPSQAAEPRHTFTASIPSSATSIAQMSVKQRMTVMPTMGRLVLEMNKSGDFYKERFQPTRATASASFIAQIKALAFEHGATAVKFVKVPADSIFAGKAIPEPYAIVFTVRMEKAPMDTAPSFEAFHEVARGYKRMAIIANLVSKFMRENGYAAYPGTALGGLTDYSRIAEVAGLGAIGYHGLLITPEDGALLRINTIYTNITNLPIEEENPHRWVRDFCAEVQQVYSLLSRQSDLHPATGAAEWPGQVHRRWRLSRLFRRQPRLCDMHRRVPLQPVGLCGHSGALQGKPRRAHFTIPMKIELEFNDEMEVVR